MRGVTSFTEEGADTQEVTSCILDIMSWKYWDIQAQSSEEKTKAKVSGSHQPNTINWHSESEWDSQSEGLRKENSICKFKLEFI